jgi:hypothetical protein
MKLVNNLEWWQECDCKNTTSLPITCNFIKVYLLGSKVHESSNSFLSTSLYRTLCQHCQHDFNEFIVLSICTLFLSLSVQICTIYTTGKLRSWVMSKSSQNMGIYGFHVIRFATIDPRILHKSFTAFIAFLWYLGITTLVHANRAIDDGSIAAFVRTNVKTNVIPNFVHWI